MKPLIILAFALCTIGATSCKKGDDPIPATRTNTPVTQQQGEWEIQSNTPINKKPNIKPKPEQDGNGSN